MSRGKYSPTISYKFGSTASIDFGFNYLGKRPSINSKDDEAFANYDEDGFDSYGYSALDHDGIFIGHGSGIDRAGYTEMDYLTMSLDDYLDIEGSCKILRR